MEDGGRGRGGVEGGAGLLNCGNQILSFHLQRCSTPEIYTLVDYVCAPHNVQSHFEESLNADGRFNR